MDAQYRCNVNGVGAVDCGCRFLLQVPAEATVHVAEKLVVIGNMVKTATLAMKGSTIRISGTGDCGSNL